MSNTPSNYTQVSVTITDDGGNSATALLPMGDLSLTLPGQDGRQVLYAESLGSLVGAALGAREYATGSFTQYLAAPNSDFFLLSRGLTAGYVSTMADLSCTGAPVKSVDMVIQYDCGAEVRRFNLDDVVFGSNDISQGDMNSRSYAFEGKGPITATDSTGTYTLVSSR